jgi:UDP-N-acetylglucosamine 1-carboxyvinyltransferase
MDKIVIEGGVPLKGEVNISGSKNAALPCLFATLLTDADCTLENIPRLRDIDTSCSLLTYLGKKVIYNNHSITVKAGKPLKTEAPYDLVRQMRASILVLGPLLARCGHASASLPGGCAIGVRPINIHLEGFEKLGAKLKLSQGMVQVEAQRLLHGQRIRLSFPSVGATENLLMASVLGSGKTTIENAAREPEIVDCADFLNKMGAQIRGAGTSQITIQGQKKLAGAFHSIIPDRIESATYLIAAVATRGHLKLNHVQSKHLESILQDLIKTGAKIKIFQNGDGTESIECAYQKALRPVDIVTKVYPGFPTDVQAQWMALMSLAHGKSVIQEKIFENRFLHAAELSRMGAQITVHEHQAIVQGVQKLSGTNVMVSDLRAGAAMVIAGLVAQGKTTIHRVYHLDRGYEKLEEKLKQVGARIRRVH